MSAISWCPFCGQECLDPGWMPRGTHPDSIHTHLREVHGLGEPRLYAKGRRALHLNGIRTAQTEAEREIAQEIIEMLTEIPMDALR